MNGWRKSGRRAGRLAALLAIGCWGAAATAGCGDDGPLPRDQHGWTERVRDTGVLPVGVATGSGGAGHEALRAREKRIVEAVARRLSARIEWRPGNAHALLEDLERRDLPLVAATLPVDSPFGQKVGISRPYRKKGPRRKDYCLAVAPGENQLLLLVDQVVASEAEQQGQ